MTEKTGISYIKGDATAPQGKGVKVIAHLCNDLGGWGKGFVRCGIPVTVYDR